MEKPLPLPEAPNQPNCHRKMSKANKAELALEKKEHQRKVEEYHKNTDTIIQLQKELASQQTTAVQTSMNLDIPGIDEVPTGRNEDVSDAFHKLWDHQTDLPQCCETEDMIRKQFRVYWHAYRGDDKNEWLNVDFEHWKFPDKIAEFDRQIQECRESKKTVSYTHLTLPTIPLV